MARPEKKKKPLKIHPKKSAPSGSISQGITGPASVGVKNKLLLLSVIFIVTIIVFGRSFQFDFVNWDDDVNVTGNANVKHLNAASVKDIFSTHVIGNYNPLTTLSFAVEYHFAGENPKVYHIDNLILHLLCTALVFWLMLLLGFRSGIAFIVGLLFGIHPMRIESVAWITERKDVLYGSFYLASLVSYTLFVKRKKKRFFLLTLLLFIPSLLSKIQAVTLPLSCLLIDYYLARPLKFKLITEKIPFFLLSVATGLIGIYFLRQVGSLEVNEVYTLVQRIFIGTYSLSVYIIKSLVPYQMSALYPYPKVLPVIYYLSPLFLAIVIYLIIRSARYSKDVVFGSLFFMVNIIFLLQVVGAGQGFIADRFTYIAYIGLFFVYAKGFDYAIFKKRNLRPVIYTAGSIYLIVLFICSLNHIKVWKDSDTLFTDVLDKHPNVPVAYNNRGRYFRTLKQPDKALADYNKAIQLNPKGYATYNNRGKIYFDMNEDDKAIDDYNTALEINHEYAEAYANRGGVYGKKGMFDKAIEDLTQAIKLNPSNSNAYSNRALAYYNFQKYELSVSDCNHYLEINPLDADMYNLRALNYEMLNRLPEAIVDFTYAIKLKPEQGVFYQNRSGAYYTSGDMDNALRDAEKAQMLGVTVNPAYLDRLKKKE